MKRFLTVTLALLLCCGMLASLMVLPLSAEEALPYNLTGESARRSEEITLSDGTATGVTWTQIELDGYYGDNRLVNVAEFDLSNTHLSVEVINSGKYMVSSQTLDQASVAYNETHEGQTVLAAINGDLWMTAIHSSAAVTTKTLKVTRGVLMIDGEIWASQQLDQENLDATNNEKGTPAGNKACFGVTDTNQPLVGSPDITITIAVNGTEITADGLNRLPARNALIVYNHRVNSSNYALNDAYEVELEVEDSSAFTAGGTINAKVIAIYKEGAVTRPALDNPNTIVLTARGNRVSALADNFKVGDEVSFSTELTDRWGNTELWQRVEDAMGGHIPTILDGKPAVANSDSTAYPTALIGYKDDGSVMMVSVTSETEGSRAALRYTQAYQFCKEMGYNGVFYLDGGGSTTFVTLEEGEYTIRHQCSDGSARAVINGVAVVWNQEPVCERQGSLGYINIPVDLSKYPPTYIDGALLYELVNAPNAATLAYDETEKAFRMTTEIATNDPYAALNLNTLARVNAEDYPYLVFKVKTDHTAATNFMLYYACGNDTGAAPSRTKSFRVNPGMEEWQYITVDMSKLSTWSGTINNIRLDIFDSFNTPENTSMYIGAIVLCKTAEEAAQVESGWVPEGSVTDYLAFVKENTPETEPETEPVTEPETEEATQPETTPAETSATEASPETTVTASATQAEEETEPTASDGCSSAVSALSALSVISLAAAAWLFRKKR